MNAFRAAWVRFAGLFRRRRLEREMSDELQAHLDGLTERKIAAGMTPKEARFAALREFGGVTQIAERARDERRSVWAEQAYQDLRYAVRSLARSPSFTITAVLTLALGIEHGIWGSLEERFARVLGMDFRGGMKSDFASGREPSGYTWHIGDSGREGAHQIVVTQFRGRTDVLFHTRSRTTGLRYYLTSPSGALEKAWHWPPQGKDGEVPLEEARIGFEDELDFWSTKVVRGAGRWPFEVKPGYDASAIFAVLAPNVPSAAGPAVDVVQPAAPEFLKLPPATDAQRELFSAAYDKLGADRDRWAYTETSRGLEDKRVLVTRFDPSKPEAERSVLLSIDGKKPKPAELQRWRDEGADTSSPLGDFSSFTSLVDLQAMRVFKEETAAVVFELPLRGGGGDFPAEKFQAQFRVNKTHRSFEDIRVKQRDSFRVAGVVKVIDAGMEMRFQTLDPALAPQPVLLKAGGGVRVLLVKFSRSVEATRTEFERVVPHDEAAAK